METKEFANITLPSLNAALNKTNIYDVLNSKNLVNVYSDLPDASTVIDATYYVSLDEGEYTKGFYQSDGVNYTYLDFSSLVTLFEHSKNARQSLLNLIDNQGLAITALTTRVVALEEGSTAEPLTYTNTTNLISRKDALMEFVSSSDKGNWSGDLPASAYTYGLTSEVPLKYSSISIDKCTSYVNGDADAAVEKAVSNIYPSPKYLELTVSGVVGGENLLLGSFVMFGQTSSSNALRAKMTFEELDASDNVVTTHEISSFTTSEIGSTSYADYFLKEVTTNALATKIKIRLDFAYYQGFTSMIVGRKV